MWKKNQSLQHITTKSEDLDVCEYSKDLASKSRCTAQIQKDARETAKDNGHIFSPSHTPRNPIFFDREVLHQDQEKTRSKISTSNLKVLQPISPLKRQRPSEWDSDINEENSNQKHALVGLMDYNDSQSKNPFFDFGSPNIGSSETKMLKHVDKQGRRRGAVVTNKQRGTEFRLPPLSRRCVQKRRRGEDSLLVTPVPPTKEQLSETWEMIDYWQEQMNYILSQDWEHKRRNWVEQCHDVLWNVIEDPTLIEKPTSEMFPKTLLPITMLSKVDKHWLDVLISSARVEKIKAPDFAELTYDPQGNYAMDKEFEFAIQFEFGFDINELTWHIHFGAAQKGLNDDLCRVIAEFVGRSKFICNIHIYFKKCVTPWWEQDGIAKMRHYSGGKWVDMIDFAPMEEVYFVQEWPMRHFLLDEYTEFNVGTPPLADEDPKVFLEKKFIAAICCQVIHLCVCKTQPPKSIGARNILKQLSMVLKGWFIGVLLGEALSPGKVKFEYDSRAPSLAPRLSSYYSNSNAM